MQIEEAIRIFEKAIELQPNVASTYVYLGYDCCHGYCKIICVARLLHVMARKDIDTAIATINKGLKADPYCMLVYMTLGSLELQR